MPFHYRNNKEIVKKIDTCGKLPLAETPCGKVTFEDSSSSPSESEVMFPFEARNSVMSSNRARFGIFPTAIFLMPLESPTGTTLIV